MRLQLATPSGLRLDSISIEANATVSELCSAIQSSKGATVVLQTGRPLSEYNLKDGDVIAVKDLGAQISWRTVFILEYLGPFLIHTFYLAYRGPSTLSFAQLLAYVCIAFHFMKREYETLLVHRFSHTTMPLTNLFKNCAHYWLLSGLWISHQLYQPDYIGPSSMFVLAMGLNFILFEMGNFYTHLILRNLRPAGSKKRSIPFGFGFTLVSCPNYLFEVLAWVSLSLMTGLWSAWIFTIVATGQMCLWALKKHRAYQREFPGYPRERKAMIPYLF